MSVVKFAEEFTQLLARWTRPVPTNEDGKDNLTIPLTNQQLLNAVQSILDTMLGVSLQAPDYSSTTTPATGIIVCTPNAPVVSKTYLDQSNGPLARSLDTLTSLRQTNNNVNMLGYEPLSSSRSQEKIDVEEDEGAESTPKDKKMISRSSPAIHISVSRSETFIREEEEKGASKKANNQESDDVFSKNDFTICEDKMKSQMFLHKLASLRESVLNVLAKIDDVKEEVCPQSTRHIRRLSSIGTSGINRTGSMKRPIQPPKLRRSSTGLPGTPTSSKSNATLPVNKTESAARRKSISATTIHISKQSKISPNRSPALTSSTKKKLMSSGDKPARNPKYAHVQSTIPKAFPNIKKSQ
ncbi:hypothetical protein ANTPLA_LOCUS7577 [Anthophora plagiata]